MKRRLPALSRAISTAKHLRGWLESAQVRDWSSRRDGPGRRRDHRITIVLTIEQRDKAIRALLRLIGFAVDTRKAELRRQATDHGATQHEAKQMARRKP